MSPIIQSHIHVTASQRTPKRCLCINDQNQCETRRPGNQNGASQKGQGLHCSSINRSINLSINQSINY